MRRLAAAVFYTDAGYLVYEEDDGGDDESPASESTL
jgi:hypothetical protein